jgi:hypothetical protein
MQRANFLVGFRINLEEIFSNFKTLTNVELSMFVSVFVYENVESSQTFQTSCLELKRVVVGTRFCFVTNYSQLFENHPVRFLPFSIYKQ